MASQVAEEYLETIYNMGMEGEPVIGARLADKFGVSRPTVTETVRRLISHGYAVQNEDKTIELTPRGREVTEDVLRRHRLAERMLFDLLGMDWIQAHEQAHAIEHGMTEELAQRISEQLNHPLTCPHGDPIPGNTTSGLAFLRERKAFRLSDAEPGEPVEIVLISEVVEDESAVLQQVGEVGLHPRAKLTVLESNPEEGVVFQLKDARRSVPYELASKLWVTSDQSASDGAAER